METVDESAELQEGKEERRNFLLQSCNPAIYDDFDVAVGAGPAGRGPRNSWRVAGSACCCSIHRIRATSRVEAGLRAAHWTSWPTPSARASFRPWPSAPPASRRRHPRALAMCHLRVAPLSSRADATSTGCCWRRPGSQGLAWSSRGSRPCGELVAALTSKQPPASIT